MRDAHFGEGGDDVAIERLAGGAGFLGAVEDGDGFHGRGDGGDEGFDGEGPEQADFEQADLLAGGEHGFHRLVRHFRAGAHHDDDALGIGRADVIEQVVLAAGDPGELVHRVLHDGGGGQVVGIAGFARLEVDVGILRGAADDGTVGRERARAVGEHQVLVDHGAHVVGGKLLDLGDFVRGAEAVEEVQEGDARFQGGGLGDQRHVHDFLHRVRGEHAEAGGARGHHVAVVAEDGERLGGQGAGGDVEHRAGEFAGDLVHVGDHQQQALRCREGGGRANPPAGRRGSAPAAPPSLCISTTVGTVPQMLVFCSADHWSAHSPMLDEGVIG